ncbi:Hypothetical predicted protein [Pelobates cultripes]|uniref:Uncharacterized protein n=1 Tax=Pelobates cultripes TaxID=61616 RepID=A0AAD1W3P1_PELCU|nr:Hypothetical predicted protein [Pelobates cultripes]
MDEFLSTPQCMAGARGPDKMAPVSPGSSSRMGSTQDSLRMDALTQMAISANMLTRQEKKELVAELHSAIREEITAVRQDLTSLEHRVDDLEVQRLQTEQHQRATDLATTRQGNLLLELRRQVENLENRGHSATTSASEVCRNPKGNNLGSYWRACLHTFWGKKHRRILA